MRKKIIYLIFIFIISIFMLTGCFLLSGNKNNIETELDMFEFKRMETQGFLFEHYTDELYVSKYNGKKEEINVPSEYNGRKVVKIDVNAFRELDYDFTIKLPDTIKIIEFMNNARLKKVVLPANLETINENAFLGCTSLSSIIFPANLKKIGIGAFKNCTSLNEITIPENVTKISENAFEYCANLAKVNLPTKLESIGAFAFKNCYLLENILFPDTLTSIEKHAFENCKLINRLDMPNKLTKVGKRAFFGCINLKILNFSTDYSQIHTEAFGNCSELKYIILPISILAEDNIFSDCSKLEYIVVPDRIDSMSFRPFNRIKFLNVFLRRSQFYQDVNVILKIFERSDENTKLFYRDEWHFNQDGLPVPDNTI